MEVLKVSSKSVPNSVAGALAEVIREKNAAEIQAIGAGAINQAVKAIAIARGLDVYKRQVQSCRRASLSCRAYAHFPKRHHRAR